MTDPRHGGQPRETPEVDEAGNIDGTNDGATVDRRVGPVTDSSAEIGSEPNARKEARDRRSRASKDG